MTLRQNLVDAAIEEIRRELGSGPVRQNGTHVAVEGEFKMARVVEAVFRFLYNDYPDDLEHKITSIIEGGTGAKDEARDKAADSILAICDHMLKALDPLP